MREFFIRKVPNGGWVVAEAEGLQLGRIVAALSTDQDFVDWVAENVWSFGGRATKVDAVLS